MANYKYAIFDPRPTDAARAANDKIFEDAEPIGVLGIEVTIPAIAARCTLGNIDPQHTGGDPSRAAIEVALECVLPFHGAMLATVRADLDAVGSMATIRIRDAGFLQYGSDEWSYLLGTGLIPDAKGTTERIRLVAESDRFARGGYPGPRSLPSAQNPWPEETATAESSRPLAAIAAALMDFKVPIADRVATMERWLVTGEEPAEYRSRVEAERLDMIRALETGAIKVESAAEGQIAVVISTHRAATTVGYAVAPVVVALNPEFRFQGGEPHPKFTVCQFTTGYVDLKGAGAELAEQEVARLREQGIQFPLDPVTGKLQLPSWGGSPTIIGSPQGQGSTLSVQEVTEVGKRHLIAR